MKILSWNVNGIRAVDRKNALNPLLDMMKPDVLCLQETKAQPDQMAELDFGKYKPYWHSAEKKGYSGVGFLSLSEPIDVVGGIPKNITDKYKAFNDKYGNAASEGRVITAEFKKFNLVSVYTLNVKDDLSRVPTRQNAWDPAFYEYIQLLEKKKPVVFCGDLNVARTEDDLARPKENEGKRGFTDEERAGIEVYLKKDYIDSFRLFHKGNGLYTWWSHWSNARANNTGWRIDYCLVSTRLKGNIKSADIYPDVLGSDHCPTSVVLEF